jgi:hypothetical protein
MFNLVLLNVILRFLFDSNLRKYFYDYLIKNVLLRKFNSM